MQLTIPCRGIWRGLEQCRSSPCESTVFPTQPLQCALVESLFTLAQCHHGCLYHSKLKSDINNASSIVFLVTNFFSAPEKENKSYSYSTTQIPWKVKIYLNVSCQWNIQKEKKIHLKWPQILRKISETRVSTFHHLSLSLDVWSIHKNLNEAGHRMWIY